MRDFDSNFYLTQNPDVKASGMDPLTHYNIYGYKEGRNPNVFFDTAYYLAQNPDVAIAGINPFTHFNEFGIKEQRNPDAFFNVSYYLAQNPDVAASGMDPLEHYLTYGATEGRNPGTFFSSSYYLQQNPDVAAAGINPLEHFLSYGVQELRNPNSSFSMRAFVGNNSDAAHDFTIGNTTSLINILNTRVVEQVNRLVNAGLSPEQAQSQTASGVNASTSPPPLTHHSSPPPTIVANPIDASITDSLWGSNTALMLSGDSSGEVIVTVPASNSGPWTVTDNGASINISNYVMGSFIPVIDASLITHGPLSLIVNDYYPIQFVTPVTDTYVTNDIPDDGFFNLKIDAALLARNATLTLSGISFSEVINLQGNVDASGMTGEYGVFINMDSRFSQTPLTADHNTIIGSAQNDFIFGGDGANSIVGGNGVNGIIGGGGSDTLVGAWTTETVMIENDQSAPVGVNPSFGAYIPITGVTDGTSLHVYEYGDSNTNPYLTILRADGSVAAQNDDNNISLSSYLTYNYHTGDQIWAGFAGNTDTGTVTVGYSSAENQYYYDDPSDGSQTPGGGDKIESGGYNFTDTFIFTNTAFGNLGTGVITPAVYVSFDSDQATTLSTLAGRPDAEIYTANFQETTFNAAFYDALDAAMADGGHTGAAFFVLTNGVDTVILYDADTHVTVAGSIYELATLVGIHDVPFTDNFRIV